MTTDSSQRLFFLEIKRVLPFKREVVFNAWTDPKLLRRWFCDPKWTVALAEVDLKVGGRYRMDMLPPEGKVNPHFGRYRAITPPSRLVFTWNSEWSCGETIVTLNFKDLGDSTELVLRHEGFTTEEARNDHNQGWPALFDHFVEAFAAK